jgi:nicotinate-nucleotide adenylyltransferase
MHVALFGGGFDPPHIGHQYITRVLLERKIADQVWYVPVKHHAFGKQVSADEHRLAMLQLIIPSQESRVRIESYELQKEGISYTYETLTHLSQAYPENRFSFVIGSDNLATFDKWLDIHPQLLNFPFYVYPRQGFAMQPMFQGMKAIENVPEVGVSSTQIRDKIKRGEAVTGLVDPQVERYIKENSLYH